MIVGGQTAVVAMLKNADTLVADARSSVPPKDEVIPEAMNEGLLEVLLVVKVGWN
jgi:hypothetical protein